MITVMQPEKNTNELSIIAQKIDTGLQAFEKRKSELIELKKDADGLKITSIEDVGTINQVSVIRKKLKKARTSIESEGKAMRDPITKISKLISEKEKELVAIIEPTEKELLAQENWVEKELDKIKQVFIDERMSALSFTGKSFDRAYIGNMSEAGFEFLLTNTKGAHEKEQAEKEQAEMLRKEEAAKVKSEREELERLRAEQAKAQAIIQAENERIRKEQHEKEIAIQAEKQKLEEDKIAAELERKLEQASKDAAEKARLKAIEDVRIESERKEMEFQEAKAKAEREEALRPDKDKLQAFVRQLGSLEYFETSDKNVQQILDDVREMIRGVQAYIHGKINELK